MNAFYVKKCLISSDKVALFPRMSQVLNLKTLASVNSYQLSIEYMRRLMKDMKIEVFFLTYHRRLIWFSMKIFKVTVHPQLVFSNNPIHQTSAQKHLRMFLDFKLNFQEHLENMFNKVNKLYRTSKKIIKHSPYTIITDNL